MTWFTNIQQDDYYIKALNIFSPHIVTFLCVRPPAIYSPGKLPKFSTVLLNTMDIALYNCNYFRIINKTSNKEWILFNLEWNGYIYKWFLRVEIRTFVKSQVMSREGQVSEGWGHLSPALFIHHCYSGGVSKEINQ